MTDEIRLLVLNCEFPPIGGGAATATRQLLVELEGFPVRSTLVTSSPGSVFETQRLHERAEAHYLPVRKKHLQYWSPRELATYGLAAMNHLRRLAREGERFDLCHAFFTLPAGLAAMLHAKERPYIVSLRGSDVPGFSGRFNKTYRLLGPLFRRIWSRADAVIANSAALRDLAAPTARGLEIGVIPNGVDTARFHPGPWRERGRTILTVARLIPRKDLATPIRATAILAKEFPDARLVIVGDGPQLGELRRLAEELSVAQRVEFRRYVPRESIADAYRDADVFVMTSTREGMSNTMLEALASGLPIVASPEALAGMEAPSARVVDVGDAEGTARAAAELLRDDHLRKRAADDSRRAALNYTWRAMAERYYEVYRRILDARGGKREAALVETAASGKAGDERYHPVR